MQLKTFMALPVLAAVSLAGSVGLASATGTATAPTYKICVNKAGVVFGANSHGSCPSGTHLVKIGASGPQGPRGLQGPAGTNGTDGTNGANGAGGVGASGPQGPQGQQGQQGSQGQQGPAGTNGTNALYTYGPYSVSNDPDSGNFGHTWAMDNFSVTIQVTPQIATGTSNTMDTSYYVTASVEGTSTTVAGAEDPNSTATEKGGVTIPMYGIETFYFPAGTDFDPYATFSYTQPDPLPAGYNPLYGMLDAWAQAYFANYSGGSTPTITVNGLTIGSTTTSYGWDFYYNVPGNSGYVSGAGTWADTDHGSSTGNITG